MQAIYTPKGKALEYCERAANLYRGCSHGCLYCYAPNALRMKREEFHKPQPRPGVLDALRKDAPKHAGREVLLCFTTDPCQPGQSAAFDKNTGTVQAGVSSSVTVDAVRILHSAGCKVVVLTKGGLRSVPVIDALLPGDKYGSTLTFIDGIQSREWEPNAASPVDRLTALKKAKDRGIETWASLEPVIDPEQSLKLIQLTSGIVDFYKVGKLNHDKRAKDIDWHDFVTRAVAQLKAQGSRYYIKKDLAAFL